MLDRREALVLAREVLDGKTRSYVSASHALAEFIVNDEATRVATCAHVGCRLQGSETLPTCGTCGADLRAYAFVSVMVAPGEYVIGAVP